MPESRETPLTALVAGHLSQDHILLVDRMPHPNEDARILGDADVPGGAAANIATMISLLGGRASLLTNVGHDDRGDALIADIAKFGVSTSLIRRVRRPSTRFLAISDDAGNRSFYLDPNHASFQLTPDDFSSIDLSAFNVLCIAGLDWDFTKCAIETAAGRMSISLNLGFIIASGNLRGGWLDTISNVELLFLNRTELQMLPDSNRDQLFALSAAGRPALVITNGSQPASYHCAGVEHAVAPAKLEIVNSLGCGDAFMAGCLVALKAGLDPIYALHVGHSCAAAIARLQGERSVDIDLTAARRLLAFHSLREENKMG